MKHQCCVCHVPVSPSNKNKYKGEQFCAKCVPPIQYDKILTQPINHTKNNLVYVPINEKVTK